jgi:hypothetical protein
MLHLPADFDDRTAILDRIDDLDLDRWEHSYTMLRVTGDPSPIATIQAHTLTLGGSIS